jgi:hypothetical protein
MTSIHSNDQGSLQFKPRSALSFARVFCPDFNDILLIDWSIRLHIESLDGVDVWCNVQSVVNLKSSRSLEELGEACPLVRFATWAKTVYGISCKARLMEA